MSETKLDPRDRLAVMVSMAGSYIESGRGDDALAVMRTVAEDVATEIARLTRELEEARGIIRARDGGEVRERVGEALKQFDDIRWADVIAALPADLVMWTWKYLRYVRSDLVAALELLGVEVEEGDPLASIPAAILSASGIPQGEGDRALWSDVDVWLSVLERLLYAEEGDSADLWAVVSLRDRVQMKLRATPTDRSESNE